MASNTSSNPATQKHVERVGETAHQAIDTAADYAGRLGEKAEEWMEMKDDWVEGTREYVRENPIAALGIAVAAGYVLSMFMRSRD